MSDIIFHRLRHTVSTLISSKVSLATAKTLLGHSDLKTTMKYMNTEIVEQRRGISKIEEYFDVLLAK